MAPQKSQSQDLEDRIRWVENTEKMNAERKKGREAALSSMREKLVAENIKTIEKDMKMKGESTGVRTILVPKRPWKK